MYSVWNTYKYTCLHSHTTIMQNHIYSHQKKSLSILIWSHLPCCRGIISPGRTDCWIFLPHSPRPGGHSRLVELLRHCSRRNDIAIWFNNQLTSAKNVTGYLNLHADRITTQMFAKNMCILQRSWEWMWSSFLANPLVSSLVSGISFVLCVVNIFGCGTL